MGAIMLVKFLGDVTEAQVRWGGNDDPRGFKELIPGQMYEIKGVEVHSWHTKYILKILPDKKFNSVHFIEE